MEERMEGGRVGGVGGNARMGLEGLLFLFVFCFLFTLFLIVVLILILTLTLTLIHKRKLC